MSQKRALIALHHYRMTGVVTFSNVLASQLKKLGYQVDVWFKCIETTDDRVIPWFNSDNTYVVTLPENSWKYDIAICNYANLAEVCRERSEHVAFVKHGTMFDLYQERYLNATVDKVVCLSSRSYELTEHPNKVLLENFVSIPDTFTYPSAIKTALIVDHRFGDMYDQALIDHAEKHGIVMHSICSSKMDYMLDVPNQYLRYDLIIGYGRVVREALVRGRRALVYGLNGGDGFLLNEQAFQKSRESNFSGWGSRAIPPPTTQAGLQNLLKYFSDNVKSEFDDLKLTTVSRSLFAPELYVQKLIET